MIAWLVETLIASSGLLLLVLILRNPVRHVFGAKVAYALWLLPALRMIMPPITSLMPDAPALTQVAQHSNVLSQLIRERVTQLETSPALPATGASLSWPLILGLLWLGGALAFAIWQVVSYRRFCRQILAGARVRRSPAKGIKLLASPRVQGPMAFGLTKRFIVFPHDALTRFDVEEHAMALAHELAHHRRGDLLSNAVALAFLALHWCNPIAWFAHRAFRTDQEMACDADVIDAIRDRGLGHAYGRALVKCAAGRRDYAAICHLTSVDRLKRRLSMLSKKSPSLRRHFAGLALTGTVVLAGLALTASGEGMAAQVGAKVSEALPIPRSADLLPSLPTAHATVAAVREVDEAATRADQLAAAADRHAAAADHAARNAEGARWAAEEQARHVPPSPAAPPAPPALAAVPPAPPAPPAAAIAPTPPVPPALGTPRIAVNKQVIRFDDRHVRAIPSRAEINAMVPIIEVSEGKGCDSGKQLVNTVEKRVSVDGKQRQKISILICNKDYARQARSEAIKGLQEARNDIAAEDELSEKTRSGILADLDRQIARMRADRD